MTDDHLDHDIAHHGEMDHHAVGTCAMGTDQHAVLDHQCRVKDVDALRVVAASIMPIIVSGNTNAPTIMSGSTHTSACTQRSTTSGHA